MGTSLLIFNSIKAFVSRKQHIVFLFVLISKFSFSQAIVFGCIKNEKDSSVPYASIFIKSLPKDSIVAYGSSDLNGHYSINITTAGEYRISFASISFQTITMSLTISLPDQKVERNPILFFKVGELKEVTVKSTTAPIKVSNDTITYDAKSFAKGDESVVEDLLKKLPGVIVENDGTVKINGQEVEKIMVEGDDFFEKGYKVLSRNMPSYPVEKIDVLQHYSNNKHLKGIENSQKVALNLRLNTDAKSKWFGNMEVGYAGQSDNLHKIGANLMKFGKKTKYYFLGNSNNIGYNATGDISQLIKPIRADDAGNSLGDNQNAGEFITVNAYVPPIGENRTNLNNDNLLSVNSIINLGSKVKLKLFGFLNSSIQRFSNINYENFYLNNTQFANTENYQLTKTKIAGLGKIDFTYDISSTKSVSFSALATKNQDKYQNEMDFNGSPLTEHLKNIDMYTDNKFVYSNKISNNKVFILNIRFIDESLPQKYILHNFSYTDIFPTIANANTSFQMSRNKMQFWGIEGHILERKKSGNLLEFTFGNQKRNDFLESDLELSKNDSLLSRPENYSNNLEYKVNDLYASYKYLITKKRFDFIVTLQAHHLSNNLTNIISQKDERQNITYLIPMASISWKFNSTSSLLGFFSKNIINSKITDIGYSFINTSFREFSKGTGSLNQLNGSKAMLHYMLGNWSDKLFGQAQIIYKIDNDYFSSNSIIKQQSEFSQKILIKNKKTLFYSSSIDRYINKIGSSIRFELSGSASTYANIINNSDLRQISSVNLQVGFKARSVFSGFINYYFGSTWGKNTMTTSAIQNTFNNNSTFFDLNFSITKKLSMQIQTERYYFGNLSRNTNTFYFIDVRGQWIISPNKLNLKWSASNLSNTNRFLDYNLTDISVVSKEFRLQPRFFLLSVEFRF